MSTSGQNSLLKFYKKKGLNMFVVKALAALQYLTKQIITQAEVADILGLTKGAVNNRIIRGNIFSDEEIKVLESRYNVSLEQFKEKLKCNSLEIVNNKESIEHYQTFRKRLIKIQSVNEMDDKEFSEKIGITEARFEKLSIGIAQPDIDLLNALKLNFDVSIDWLLYGEGTTSPKNQLIGLTADEAVKLKELLKKIKL